MNKPYLRIGLDLDGVIRDFIGSLIDTYKRTYPDKSYAYPTTWKLDEHFEIGKAIYDFITIHQYEIFAKADLLKGAKEFLAKLDHPYYEIVIITSPWCRGTRYANIDWLYNKLIPIRELHQTADKSCIDCDVYLDDYPRNILGYERQWESDLRDFNKLIVVYDQPWNRESFRYAVRSFNHDQTFQLIETFRQNK